MMAAKTKSGWYRVWETKQFHLQITGTTFLLFDRLKWKWFGGIVLTHWKRETKRAGLAVMRQFGPFVLYVNSAVL